MIENEIAFVFTADSFESFCQHSTTSIIKNNSKTITDFYLNKELRVRKEHNPEQSETYYYLVEKKGNKASGSRIETTTQISPDAADILSRQTKLTIVKIRHNLQSKIFNNCIATVDFISSPMSLVILELESQNESFIEQNTIDTMIHKYQLQLCPLSTWKLFKRKIGICGAPSSGKSETAKYLSHILNTQFQANSFHVIEYATSFIQKYQRIPEFNDSFFIWHGQREREKDARTSDIVISDSPTFLPYIYMKYHGPNCFDSFSAMSMAKMYKRALSDIQTYTDLILLNLIEYRNNGVRYHNHIEAKHIQNMIISFLTEHRVPYIQSDCLHTEDLLYKLFYINNIIKKDNFSRTPPTRSGDCSTL